MSDSRKDHEQAWLRDFALDIVGPEATYTPLDMGEVERFLDSNPDAGPQDVRAWLRAKGEQFA
jgi:hypothetical protein